MIGAKRMRDRVYPHVDYVLRDYLEECSNAS